MTIDAPSHFPLAGKRIWVAGHRGLVGSAIVRRLARESCSVLAVGRDEVDLRRQAETEAWIAKVQPDAIVVAAATVGGILANATRPAEFLYDNLAIEANIIHGAHQAGVQRLLFLGSSCIYPRNAPQPMAETALLTGPLEETNQWYSVAKIAGIKLCQAYRTQYGRDYVSAMPANLYGPGDNFDLRSSHVLPALLVKIIQAQRTGAQQVEVWGTGAPLREFLYVDDLADGTVFLLEHFDGYDHINIGTGAEVSIKDLATLIASVVGYQGQLRFDSSKPDGTPRKVMDHAKIHALGWRARTSLEDGIRATLAWLEDNPELLEPTPAQEGS
ncbi:MAG: GDP-L-fucose synthase family protein [Rhodospirillaceae bacterium]